MKSALESSVAYSLKSGAKAFYWKPLLSSERVRAAYFDAAKPNTLLLTTAGEEKFLVSSSDRAIGRDVFINGEFDFRKFERVLGRLDKSFERDLLVDIGANIGTICIPAVKRRYFERAVAFEPEPFNYLLLCTNVNINGLSTRITSHNIALGEKEGEELAFELSETNYGDHRIRLSDADGFKNEATRRVIRVRSEPFDKVLEGIDPKRTLIWMDTQGFEGFVLKGAEASLRKRPPLVIEFWPYGMNRCGSYETLKSVICGAGYEEFFDLDANSPPLSVSGDAFDRLFERLGKGKVFWNFTDLLIV